MKLNTILFIVLAAALCLPAVVSAEITVHCDKHSEKECNLFRGENVSMDLDDGVLVLTHEDDDETVEIAENGDLTVNERRVRLNASERDLVADYYATFDGIVTEAKELGVQGAKIGAKGAVIGLKAALGALLLISPDYDEEDLEEALDDEGEKLDRAAQKLEKRAKRLEKKADRLEKLHDEMRDRIDELDDLGWF